ncbi:chlorite dismutase family protein [Rhizobium sp. IBUN]|uniref:chlorite dismutase family protein n=1 Tax=Rhizobium sp. IBUN TaxID=1042326 RepID=UPI00042A2F79|nr:chlorite dismutase family protein [Rhizobium sp. IBUN]
MTEIGAPNRRATTFIGGNGGEWAVVSQRALLGPPIAAVSRVAMIFGSTPGDCRDAAWILRGVATNDRYTTREEKHSLVEKQVPIGRPEATRAALILLRKNADWWAMPQDERRAVLEEQSHHIAIGLRYLPAVARRLLHCRDLESEAPFDFLGFLDFAPADEVAFEDMLGQLRSTKEWSYMEREIDIRLVKPDR